MTAAIYARKSTEQNHVGDEAKSVTRQIEHAKAYAAAKGWTVTDAHVYVDDGISGALFGAGRPGLARLLNALAPRPPFQVLVMSEESRLGREAIETGYTLKQITDAGVAVWFYLEDRQRTLDTATDKVMMALSNFAAEMEREKAAQRTYDAQLRKARMGHVAGGNTYGYDNVAVTAAGPDGKALRLHVARAVNQAEADVIRRIFSLYAAGRGSASIATLLNREHVPGPRGAWQQSAIRGLLKREIYIGRLTWGKLKTKVIGGKVRFDTRPADQLVVVDAPELRIIPDELWNTVQARRARAQRECRRLPGGQLLGRPTWADGHSEYLWPGLASCAVCGGSIRTLTLHMGPKKRRGPVRYYVCSRYEQGGAGACSNSVRVRHDTLDRATIEAVAPLLSGSLIEAAVVRAIEKLRTVHAPALDRIAALERERAVLDQRIERAVDLLLDGAGSLPDVKKRLGEYRTRREELEAERRRYSALQPSPRSTLQRSRGKPARPPQTRWGCSRGTRSRRAAPCGRCSAVPRCA